MATMSSAHNDWYARMQKRRDAELSLLRRPSETESQSTSSDRYTSNTSPASPKSSHSTANSTATGASSSVKSNFDQLAALQQQLQQNTAQIEANEARMTELREFDERMGSHISDRLASARDINESLRSLHALLARTEAVAKEFGLDRKRSS